MSREEIRHLKEYVKRHPDNQMGWYLLGKQYESDNKMGKAMYCFLQAKEVYEAFEKKSLPELPPEQIGLEDGRKRAAFLSAAHDGSFRFRLPRRARRWLWTVAALLLFFIPAQPQSPIAVETAMWTDPPPMSDRMEGEDGGPAAPAEAEEGSPAGELPETAEIGLQRPAMEPFHVIYAKEQGELELEALEVLMGRGRAAAETLLVRAPVSEDGRWILWTEAPAYVLAASRSEDGRIARVEYYDPSVCWCLPADSAHAAERFARWQADQEQRWVAMSAMVQYERLHGKLPEQIEQIVQPYPDNMLSGYTPLMETVFREWMGASGEESVPAGTETAAGGELGEGNAADAAAHPEWRQEPLEIIVDPVHYRLALVKGPIILRMYPVGLGGERTPRGEFHITERVRNPNGRADGEFGSRGMTLSDTLYAIHGTNEPDSIGKDESLGCIRMLNEDIEELFGMTPLGTKVTIADGSLPSSGMRGAERFRVPSLVEETNPHKVYRWLN